MHMHTVVCVMQVYNVCVRGPDGDTMYIQWSNPMGTQCMYKELILCGTMFTCTENQSYGTVHVATHT